MEEVWDWKGIKVSSDLSFVCHEVSISIIELDMIEVTVDSIKTLSSSEIEL